MKGTVVLTGASRGLGLALSRELVLRHGVKRLLMVSKDGSELQKACCQIQRELDASTRVSIQTLEANVTVAAEVERIATTAGPISVWINNVGYSGGYELLAHRPPEEIVQVVEETLTSAALGSREAIRHRVPVVVNVAGGGSSGEACPTFAAYGASKRALVGLTESLALEEPATCFALVWPGIFKSRLLFDGMGQPARYIFDRLAATPEAVAQDIAPQVVALARRPKPGRVRHLTRALPAVQRLLAKVRKRTT